MKKSEEKEEINGTIIELSDTSRMASLKDGVDRKPHQIVTILLDNLSQSKFHELAFSKKVVIKIK